MDYFIFALPQTIWRVSVGVLIRVCELQTPCQSIPFLAISIAMNCSCLYSSGTEIFTHKKPPPLIKHIIHFWVSQYHFFVIVRGGLSRRKFLLSVWSRCCCDSLFLLFSFCLSFFFLKGRRAIFQPLNGNGFPVRPQAFI